MRSPPRAQQYVRWSHLVGGETNAAIKTKAGATCASGSRKHGDVTSMTKSRSMSHQRARKSCACATIDSSTGLSTDPSTGSVDTLVDTFVDSRFVVGDRHP